MKNILTLLFISFFIFSCKSPEPREPKVERSGKFLQESAERNKKLQVRQEKHIQKIIDKDTAHHYHNSANGFWYKYEKRNKKDTVTPGFGDLVEFEYDITTVEGDTIYTREEIGPREYLMDKEELITGLRKGLQIMKEGETITFYFPSTFAFGYYGDHKKIGRNLPIRSTVTVNSIHIDQDKELK